MTIESEAREGPRVRGGAEFTERLSFRDDVRLEPDGDQLRVVHRWGAQVLRQPSGPLTEALRQLADGPVSVDDLADGLLLGWSDPAAGDADLARLHWALGQLHSVLVRSLWAGGQRLVTMTALAPEARLSVTPPPGGPVRLSRFVYLHRRDDALVAESPLSRHRLELCHPEAVGVVAALASPASAGSRPGVLRDRPSPTADVITSWLIEAGMAEAATPGGDQPRFAEDDDPVLRQWAFHDLLFHSRSRLGRHDDDFGATFPFLGDLDPEPAVRPLPEGETVPLPRPDLASMLRRDVLLTEAMEARRSVRSYAQQPPTKAEIGELLYRTARIRATRGPDTGGGLHYAASDRPYPCGGAAYDIEFYLTISRCDGLARGSYYYDPAGHRLILLNHAESSVQALLHQAYVACAGATIPDVLITMTARFQRLGWKYQGMAYSATLKHVGVLYQSLYLVATAMGLAPCGLGTGDADLAARAFGLDWACESSVGEFMIGRADPAAGPSGNCAMPSYRTVNDPQWATEAARLRQQRDCQAARTQ
jgi:SagB-type dehydrogenase family enzyme